tara:strand:- start:23600 stop:23989 length:390 start_codon:yes stop_codon:yes gene_type:complete
MLQESKIGHMRNFRFILFVILLIGCSLNQSEETEFGASYSINLNESSPSIEVDKLTISISYSGCSSAHSFTLKNRLSASTAEIWLFKETKDQLCDGIIQEVRTFQLPQEISTSKNIVLITPVDETIVLK